MPRARLNQQIPQPPHPAPGMPQHQQQQRIGADLQVQRSQGVIYLTTSKPQQTAPPPAPPPQVPTIPQMSHQIQSHHSSMYQPQHVPAFVPPTMMQSPFFPYYNPVPLSMPHMPSLSNDVYTPNGNVGNSYENYMQRPPSPIKSKKQRRSRVTRQDDSDSSDDDFIDDDEDPDWNPVANEEPEPATISRRGTPRGRRPSTTPRGRGRGRGRGTGRGRGRISNSGSFHQESPPCLTDQTNHSLLQAARQTRSSQGFNMPALNAQATPSSHHQGQLSFGELVSQAVQSLNVDQDDSTYSTTNSQKNPSIKYTSAVVIRQADGSVSIEKVPVSRYISLFAHVDYSIGSMNNENRDEAAMENEDDALIMAYEIIQEDDKHRQFLCEICGKASKSRILHNRHLVMHETELRFACCICSEMFVEHEKLKPHLRKHHGTGIFVCPDLECEGIFQERKSLDDHEFACHPDARPFVCRFCLDRFPTQDDAYAHEDSAHEENTTASCLKCGTACNTKTELKQHYIDMHEEKQCQFCSDQFENKPALDEHLNAVHAELMKPPTPPREPTPEPPDFADDDPLPSPIGGNDDDDDDDEIVVVEEQKKVPQPRTRGRPSTKSKPPESKSPKTPKTAARKKPLNDDDIIILSSDSEDEKDPDWKSSETKSRKHSQATILKTRPVRNKAEYVIIVESSTDTNAKDLLKKTSSNRDQPLTFVMGKSGELVHVPTASDPHPPNSLPMKKIMEAIKGKNLTDNSTIIIEDNKIKSIKSTNHRKGERDIPPAIPSTSKSVLKPAILRDSAAKKWVRPAPEIVDITDVKERKSSPKPQVVAKKRTGGLPRTESLKKSSENDRDKKRSHHDSESKQSRHERHKKHHHEKRRNSDSDGSSHEREKKKIHRDSERRRHYDSDTSSREREKRSHRDDSERRRHYDKDASSREKEKRSHRDNEKRRHYDSDDSSREKKRSHRDSEKRRHYDSDDSSREKEKKRSHRDNEKRRHYESGSSGKGKEIEVKRSTNESEKKDKTKTAGPIARKRTGGTNSLYDNLKHKQSDSDSHKVEERVKQSRKSSLGMRNYDELENPQSSHHTKQIPNSSTKPSNDFVKQKGKKGRRKSRSASKAQRRAEKMKKQQIVVDETATTGTEHDLGPKRSLRLALKTSIEESQADSQTNEDDFYVETVDPKRGRESKQQTKMGYAAAHASKKPSANPRTSVNMEPAGDGQVVMKTLVNGVWQDVVIGTKIPNDNSSETAYASNSSMLSHRQTNAMKSTTGSKKQLRAIPDAIKITPPSRRGRKPGGRGGGRGGRGGRRGKKANAEANCWRDDRYQFFASGDDPLGPGPQVLGRHTSSHMYSVHEEIVPTTHDTEYSYEQGYENDDDGAVLPFSLSSYMDYHETQDMDSEDHGVPVIVNAYHLEDTSNHTGGSGVVYDHGIGESNDVIHEDYDEDDQIEEVPLRDPLAMDDVPSSPPYEEEEEDDPLVEPTPPPAPPPVIVPKKGTKQDASSAISNLRSVLTQITFKSSK